MNIDDIYASDSNHLKSEDLPAGKEVPVTIASYELLQLDDKNKLCLTFAGKEKTMVVNKTNATAIAHVYGNDPDSWVNKSIFLFTTKTEFNGKSVDCIRVRVPLEQAQPGDTAGGF